MIFTWNLHSIAFPLLERKPLRFFVQSIAACADSFLNVARVYYHNLSVTATGAKCHLLDSPHIFTTNEEPGAYPIYFSEMLVDNRYKLTDSCLFRSLAGSSSVVFWSLVRDRFPTFINGIHSQKCEDVEHRCRRLRRNSRMRRQIGSWDCCFHFVSLTLLVDAACFPFSWDVRLLIVAFPRNW